MSVSDNSTKRSFREIPAVLIGNEPRPDDAQQGLQPQEDGRTKPLHIWAEIGDADEINQLLEKEKSELDAKDSRGMTALAIAAKNKRIKAVSSLLEFGPSLYIPDNDGRTAFHWAAQNGDADIMSKLLATGYLTTVETAPASQPTDGGGSSLDTRDEIGESSTRISTDGNIHNGKGKGVPGTETIAMNIDLLDVEWRTPLYLASESGSVDTVKLLLERGADERLSDKRGKAPIYIAAIAGRKGVVEELSKEDWVTGRIGPMPAYTLFPNFNTPDKEPLGLGALITDLKTMETFPEHSIHNPPSNMPIRHRTLSGFKVSLAEAKTGRYGPWAAAIAGVLIPEGLIPEASQLEHSIIEVSRVKNTFFYPSRAYLGDCMRKFRTGEHNHPRSGPVYVVTGMKIAHDACLPDAFASRPEPESGEPSVRLNAPPRPKQDKVNEPPKRDFVLAVCLWKLSYKRSMFSREILRCEPYGYGNYMVPITKPTFPGSDGN
ncbi:hypothetical protein Daesc_001050 [Daldinia eschscholtzii]|uniref:Ankyrin n=1 Tax=Daldinia eschscholtzii TaxID=292717 RepID=A0AAX6N0N9_9PEZI